MGGGSLGGGLSPTLNKLVSIIAHLANIRNLIWKIKSKKIVFTREDFNIFVKMYRT